MVAASCRHQVCRHVVAELARVARETRGEAAPPNPAYTIVLCIRRASSSHTKHQPTARPALQYRTRRSTDVIASKHTTVKIGPAYSSHIHQAVAQVRGPLAVHLQGRGSAAVAHSHHRHTHTHLVGLIANLSPDAPADTRSPLLVGQRLLRACSALALEQPQQLAHFGVSTDRACVLLLRWITASPPSGHTALHRRQRRGERRPSGLRRHPLGGLLV